jgi:DNA-binding XRE family transcriptional regulator
MPQKIKTLRRKKALSQRELAALAGISTSTLNRIETGKEQPIQIGRAHV